MSMLEFTLQYQVKPKTPDNEDQALIVINPFQKARISLHDLEEDFDEKDLIRIAIEKIYADFGEKFYLELKNREEFLHWSKKVLLRYKEFLINPDSFEE